MWEYVKGSEADFEGAPEWATLSNSVYWYECRQQGEGKYLFRGRGASEGMDPRFNHSARIIAERRKVDNLQTRINDVKLEHAFKTGSYPISGDVYDTVQRPAHYNQSGIECIDAIAAAVKGKSGIEASLVGNVIKYLWRYELKNGVEDIQKAQWYLERLVKELSK